MKAAIVTIFSLVSVSAFAHGMSKPGPNNGYIKMPGTYHIELVTDKNNLKIFFLDVAFKPLPITNATVKVTLRGFKEEAVNCTKAATFFACDTKEANMKKYKEIVVESSKGGERAAQSVYKLPLSY